jgi:hypothetical protein
MNLKVRRTPWTGDQPIERPLPTQNNTNTEEKRTDIHASSGIQTHESSVGLAEGNHACGHCDRQLDNYHIEIRYVPGSPWPYFAGTTIYSSPCNRP